MSDLKLFPPELADPARERAFRRESMEQSLPLVRMALLAAILIYSLFALVDPLIQQNHLQQSWAIRLGVGMPLLVLTLAATWMPSFLRWNQPFLAIMALLISATIIVLTTMSEGHLYYVGLIFAMLFIFIFLRVRYLIATAIGMALVAAYMVVCQTVAPIDFAHFVVQSALLAGALIVVMLVAYYYERSLRREYIQRIRVQEHEQELYRQAYFDSQTGLANRNGLIMSLNQRLEAAESTALLIINVESFSSINSTYGYDGGDQLLVEMSARLKGKSREGDLLARLGGGEFGLLVPVENGDDVLRLGESLLPVLQYPYELRRGTVAVNFNIGISLPENGHRDADRLIQQAELALHEAEAGSEGRVVLYGAEHGARVSRRVELTQALRLAYRQSEFRVHYQPKVDLHTGQWVGVEALLRWERPGHGLLGPGEFLDALENSDLMVPVGEWVLEQALGDYCAWMKRGVDLPVAVNLAARQCSGSDIFGTVMNMMDANGLSGHALSLELTETVALSHQERIRTMVGKLEDQGIHVALDDFGTGFSSLSHLYRLPVSIIKIDRSFVAGLSQKGDYGKLVDAILTMSSRLGKKVVAEGIEEQRQWAFLVEHGCHVGQGFLFGRAMRAELIEQLMLEGKTAITLQPVTHKRE